MFRKYAIDDTDGNLFHRLSQIHKMTLEDVARGRKGGILVDVKDGLIPLVRSTTQYQIPSQHFQPIHYQLMDRFREIDKDFIFDNAMIEIYDDQYRTMKGHSDQALDLADDSYIGILSSYEHDSDRTLQITDKISGEHFAIKLDHLSFVVFSTNVNMQYTHKIVLDNCSKNVNNVNNKTTNNKWLGMTFRKSKTMIEQRDGKVYFAKTDTILHLATKDQRNEFYKYRALENKGLKEEFIYPQIDYTISPSDLLMPE